MSEYEIVQRQPQTYAAIHVTVSMAELGAVVPPLNGEVFDWLQKRDVAPTGPAFWKYDVINMPGSLTIEAGVAMAGVADGDGRVIVAQLAAGDYLETTYHGHPDGLMQATADLLGYADKKGLAFERADSPSGETWAARLEYYLSDPAEEPDLNNWDTLLSFKLAG